MDGNEFFQTYYYYRYTDAKFNQIVVCCCSLFLLRMCCYQWVLNVYELFRYFQWKHCQKYASIDFVTHIHNGMARSDIPIVFHAVNSVHTDKEPTEESERFIQTITPPTTAKNYSMTKKSNFSFYIANKMRYMTSDFSPQTPCSRLLFVCCAYCIRFRFV